MSDVIASPSVRALAARKGIDIERLAADLGRQTIAREDLGAETPTAAPAAADTSLWDVDHTEWGPVTEEKVSRFARIAARNLTTAATVIPSVTHHDSAEVTVLESFRASMKDEAAARGVRLTALAFHIKALARVLREFPKFNASLSADGETLYLKEYVHIGMAADTDYGLVVPVLRDVDRKGLWQIAAEISELAGRAKARKLRPEEMGGASMSVSSLGGIGGEAFTPIINPPEVAILGITRAEMRPKWTGEGFEPALMLPLDLTYDHRVINGADAARFLRRYCDLLSDPRRMLL